MESQQRVRQAESHHPQLVMSLVYLEHRLLNIGRVNTNLVVSSVKVELRENLGTQDLIDELLYSGYRKPVFHGDSV